MNVLDSSFDEPRIVDVLSLFLDLDSSQLKALEVCTIATIQVEVLVVGNGEASWDFKTERHAENCIVLDCRLERELCRTASAFVRLVS